MSKKLYGLGILILCLSFAGAAFALTSEETLGKAVYEDPAFSLNGNQSCQTCHHPNSGFADTVNRRSLLPVSEGSVADLFGDRNAPPAAYAAYSPALHWNVEEPGNHLFIGGLFWDGRATGRFEISGTEGIGGGATGDPLADQAKGPFLNGVEMALLNEAELLRIFAENKKYVRLYNKVHTIKFADASPGVAYNNIALAISAFEKSNILNKFSSKFDAFRAEQELKGQDVSLIMLGTEVVTAIYTPEEVEGLKLFNTESDPNPQVVGGGGCFLCHPVPDQLAGPAESVFTDFSYDNLGIPVNLLIGELRGEEMAPDIGLAKNPEILEILYNADTDTDFQNAYPDLIVDQKGKFKVSSLRNIAKTAPYGHNGFFLTLVEIVQFYNTRDVAVNPAWPVPEVSENVNSEELGNLGLSPPQEMAIVAFLETLTDGYVARAL